MRRIALSAAPLLLLSLTLGGCASAAKNPKDPFEPFNRGMYRFNDTVDKAVLKPLAKGYNTVVPPPGRMMLSNFFSNLGDVVVAVNDLLQFKLVQAAADTGRIVVNTTIGMFGLVDVATPIGLEKHDEDFGQTLGKWGLGSGPYLVLPLLGPSSVRDGTGLYADTRVGMMRRINKVDVRNQAIAVNMLGRRAALLDQETILDEAAVDRYAFIRDAYLQHRESLVYDGNPPRRKYEDEDEEDSKPVGKNSSGALDEKLRLPAAIAATAPPEEATPVGDASDVQYKLPVVHRVWVTQAGDAR